MWDRKDIIIICILSCFIVDLQAHDLKNEYYTVFEYSKNSTGDFTFVVPNGKPPAKINHTTDVWVYKNTNILTLNLSVRKVREPFNLTLLAVPKDFMKDETCHETVIETIKEEGDIHQFARTYKVPQGDGPYELEFLYIFYGCYYVLMTNSEGKSWQKMIQVFNSTYPYRTRKISLISEPRHDPVQGNRNKRLTSTIDVPQSCFIVHLKVYEFDHKYFSQNNKTIEKEINDTITMPTVECNLRNVRKEKDAFEWQCEKSENRYFKYNITKDENGTAVKFEWENLTPNGGVYYFRSTLYPLNCMSYVLTREFMLWRLFSEDMIFRLEPADVRSANAEDKVPAAATNLPKLVNVLLVIALAAVLVYFVTKYYRNKKELKEKQRLDGIPPLLHIIDEGKLEHILLVYAWDSSSQFMTEMRNLKYLLKQNCQCEVHDVYSERDRPSVEKLGAHEWVKELLIEGSKVVWVDTPQLRSYFNDKQAQNASTDFRHAAMPYAIELATSLFQDSKTQYLYHFVVRVEGFEVEDGCDNDPLRVVTPQTRYYIPGNFSRLCKDITATSTTPKYNQNQYV